MSLVDWERCMLAKRWAKDGWYDIVDQVQFLLFVKGSTLETRIWITTRRP
ncbi:hypothetical protein KDA_55500 [Dictyobacter alpinus]|uniref:Uncharacterized protein n=1 Tax=Dictyobacter alpinus TaxID=2014873 RepID=A0A402BFG5_9CHLR|nr:hypothetical protein KDA_55500 [Dictyobacter alpinus]